MTVILIPFNLEQCSLFKWKAYCVSKVDFTFLSFLQTFWWDSTLSFLRKLYNSKFMESMDLFFENKLPLFGLTQQVGSFVFFLNVDSKLFLIQNHLLLVSTIYIYNSRWSEITKVKNKEKKNSINNEKKSYYVQEKIAASLKCFEDQNVLKFTWFSLWVGKEGKRAEGVSRVKSEE